MKKCSTSLKSENIIVFCLHFGVQQYHCQKDYMTALRGHQYGSLVFKPCAATVTCHYFTK